MFHWGVIKILLEHKSGNNFRDSDNLKENTNHLLNLLIRDSDNLKENINHLLNLLNRLSTCERMLWTHDPMGERVSNGEC